MITRLMHRDQRGFTLIEMLVVVTLLGLISTGITASIMQVLAINTRSSNHMIAVRQVQQAGKEMNKDTLQAHIITPGENSGFPLTLEWTDWEGLENEVVYTLQDMPSSPDLKMLQRSHTVDGEPVYTAPLVVAEYIDPAQTSCCCDCNGNHDCVDEDEEYCDCDVKLLIFKITAVVGTETETRVYEIEPRSD